MPFQNLLPLHPMPDPLISAAEMFLESSLFSLSQHSWFRVCPNCAPLCCWEPLMWSTFLSHTLLVHVLQGHTSLCVAQKHALIRLLKINVHTSSDIQEISHSCPQLHSNLSHSHASCYSSSLGYKWRNQLELSLSKRGRYWKDPVAYPGMAKPWGRSGLQLAPGTTGARTWMWSGFCTSYHCSSLGVDSLLPFFFFFLSSKQCFYFYLFFFWIFEFYFIYFFIQQVLISKNLLLFLSYSFSHQRGMDSTHPKSKYPRKVIQWFSLV